MWICCQAEFVSILKLRTDTDALPDENEFDAVRDDNNERMIFVLTPAGKA